MGNGKPNANEARFKKLGDIIAETIREHGCPAKVIYRPDSLMIGSSNACPRIEVQIPKYEISISGLFTLRWEWYPAVSLFDDAEGVRAELRDHELWFAAAGTSPQIVQLVGCDVICEGAGDNDLSISRINWRIRRTRIPPHAYSVYSWHRPRG